MAMQNTVQPPAGYKWIRYAHNMANNFVALPYGFDLTDVLELKGSVIVKQNGEHWLVGPTTWNTSTNRFGFLGSSNSKIMFTLGSIGTPNNLLQTSVSTTNDVHIARYADKKFELLDTNSVADLSSANFGQPTNALRLFYGYSNCWGNIYYFKQIKADGSELYVRPMQNTQTGVVEMYDIVSKTIMPRTGTLHAPEE